MYFLPISLRSLINLLLFALVFYNSAGFANTLSDRFSKSREVCLNTLKEPTFKKLEKSDEQFYKKSLAQRFFAPAFIGIFDIFGSGVQGMIIGDSEAARVSNYLRFLSRDANEFRIKNNLNNFQALCVASCMTNILMKPNPDINPYTSMNLAIYSGEGFCRHYSLTAKKIAEQMAVDVSLGFAPEHAFLTYSEGGIEYIFDPTKTNGFHDCTFFIY